MKRPDRFIPIPLEEAPWLQARFPNGDAKGIQYRRLLPGSGGLPQLQYSRYDPHWTEARHRHAEDEVLILTRGDITVEGVTYRAPSALFVGRGTLYGPLTAGPQGVEFYRVAFTEEMIQQAPEKTDA